ncbi:MAG: hypothetical protein OXB84_02060 [Halobacteriovoraceae bacterium]|nr:hypothetical protein [Halobacteriovoraceae bacterium]
MDNFKSDLLKSINKINDKIRRGEVATDEDLKKILLYNLLEEESNVDT